MYVVTLNSTSAISRLFLFLLHDSFPLTTRSYHVIHKGSSRPLLVISHIPRVFLFLPHDSFPLLAISPIFFCSLQPAPAFIFLSTQKSD